jgi:curved DNA-binding protein CbpA
MSDPWQVLGASKDASDVDIRRSWLNACKRYHPDVNKSDPQAQAKFVEATEAYNAIKDAPKRSAWHQQSSSQSDHHRSNRSQQRARGARGASQQHESYYDEDFSRFNQNPFDPMWRRGSTQSSEDFERWFRDIFERQGFKEDFEREVHWTENRERERERQRVSQSHAEQWSGVYNRRRRLILGRFARLLFDDDADRDPRQAGRAAHGSERLSAVCWDGWPPRSTQLGAADRWQIDEHWLGWIGAERRQVMTVRVGDTRGAAPFAVIEETALTEYQRQSLGARLQMTLSSACTGQAVATATWSASERGEDIVRVRDTSGKQLARLIVAGGHLIKPRLWQKEIVCSPSGAPILDIARLSLLGGEWTWWRRRDNEQLVMRSARPPLHIAPLHMLHAAVDRDNAIAPPPVFALLSAVRTMAARRHGASGFQRIAKTLVSLAFRGK